MASPLVTIIQATVQLVSAGLYLWVGHIVLQRQVTGEAKRANALFGVWWIALGIVFLLSPFYSVLPRLFGYEDLALAVTLLNLILVLIVVGVWGLVAYLAYLYTGSSRSFWPITAFYVLLTLALLYLIAWLGPDGFDEMGRLTFQREQLSGAPAVSLGLLFSLPVVIAALAYGSLFFRIREPTPRYRIGLVAGAFLLQFGWSTLSSILQLPQRYPDSLTLALVSNALGIVSAVCILLAFRPPESIQRRLRHAETGGT
jgi:hypothetical protein